MPVNFTPRSILQTVITGATGATGASGATGATGSTGGSSTTTSGSQIQLSNIAHLNEKDWSTVMPSAVLQAVLSDANTKVLQSPQVRSVDNIKATLKIGDRVPTATGSFQPGIGGVGINPLVNTQFTYIDTGVNVDLLPRVHDNGDVSLEVDLDINSVNGHVNLGGATSNPGGPYAPDVPPFRPLALTPRSLESWPSPVAISPTSSSAARSSAPTSSTRPAAWNARPA